MSLKASRTPSKIDDNSRVLDGVNDDYRHPDWAGVLGNVLDCLCMLQESNI